MTDTDFILDMYSSCTGHSKRSLLDQFDSALNRYPNYLPHQALGLYLLNYNETLIDPRSATRRHETDCIRTAWELLDSTMIPL